MIQPVKLDGPTPSRESSQGDSRDGGFSGMLANLVEPSGSQSKAQASAPQRRSEAPARPEKPQEAPQSEASNPAEASQVPERDPAPESAEAPTPPAEQKPPAKPSKPRGAEKASAEKTADQPKPDTQVAPALQVAVAQMPVEATEPPGIQEAPPVDASTAAPLATPPPPPEAAPSQSGPLVSDQKSESTEARPPVNQSTTTPVPAEAMTPIALPAAPMPAQIAPVEAEPASAEARISSEKAPLAIPPKALDLKAALTQKAQEEGNTDKTAIEVREPSAKRETTTVSAETPKEPALTANKTHSTKEALTPQMAEATLNLKPPSPKPALTEFLSRPGPVMETPSVVQTIQEARNTSSNPSTGISATALPGIESSRGSELFQGRDSNPGQGSQTPSQASSPTGNIPSSFSLNAPSADLAKMTVPEVAAARPSLPMEQMEGSVRWILKNDQNSAELQLRPESLGKVQIQLKVEGNQVHAKVWASEASTVPLLESHRGMLESSLREQGLSLGSFDLHQGHGAPRQQMDQTAGQASFAAPVKDLPKEPSLEVTVPMAPVAFGNRRVEVFA